MVTIEGLMSSIDPTVVIHPVNAATDQGPKLRITQQQPKCIPKEYLKLATTSHFTNREFVCRWSNTTQGNFVVMQCWSLGSLFFTLPSTYLPPSHRVYKKGCDRAWKAPCRDEVGAFKSSCATAATAWSIFMPYRQLQVTHTAASITPTPIQQQFRIPTHTMCFRKRQEYEDGCLAGIRWVRCEDMSKCPGVTEDEESAGACPTHIHNCPSSGS